MGKMFCITLKDYASNEQKVREAIQELEMQFPPPKAEEGLSSQFQQIDRNNGYGYNNGGFMTDEIEDKKASKKKKGQKGSTIGGKDKSKAQVVFEVPNTSQKNRNMGDVDGKKKSKGG